MITAVKREPTVKKVFNLPDRMVEKIDVFAIGEYASRSDFLTCAIRNLLRDIQRRSREYELRLLKTNKSDIDVVMRSYDKAIEHLVKIQKKYISYDSEGMTPITIYLTSKQIRYVDQYVGRQLPLKTLQDFARVAAIWELEEMDRIIQYDEELVIDLTSNS